MLLFGALFLISYSQVVKTYETRGKFMIVYGGDSTLFQYSGDTLTITENHGKIKINGNLYGPTIDAISGAGVNEKARISADSLKLVKAEDSLGVHRGKINKLRDTSTVHRTAINKLIDTTAAHITKINKLIDTTLVHRKAINKLIDTTSVHRTAINKLIDTIVVHRTAINKLIDTAVVHKGKINNLIDTSLTHRTAINKLIDTVGMHKDKINNLIDTTASHIGKINSLLADTSQTIRWKDSTIENLLVFQYLNVNGNQNLKNNRGYIISGGSIEITLPATSVVGARIEIIGSTGSWKLKQNASQVIYYGTSGSTPGAGGYLASQNARDCVTLIYVATNTWVATSGVGNLTIN